MQQHFTGGKGAQAFVGHCEKSTIYSKAQLYFTNRGCGTNLLEKRLYLFHSGIALGELDLLYSLHWSPSQHSLLEFSLVDDKKAFLYVWARKMLFFLMHPMKIQNTQPPRRL